MSERRFRGTSAAAAQQRLARAKRRSRNRERKRETIAARHRRIASQRKDFHHKQARELVERYDLLVVEDLKIANMLPRVKPVADPDNPGHLKNGAQAKSGLSRSISDGLGGPIGRMAGKVDNANAAGVVMGWPISSGPSGHPGHPAGSG